jgi:hypothetical protein
MQVAYAVPLTIQTAQLQSDGSGRTGPMIIWLMGVDGGSERQSAQRPLARSSWAQSHDRSAELRLVC